MSEAIPNKIWSAMSGSVLTRNDGETYTIQHPTAGKVTIHKGDYSSDCEHQTSAWLDKNRDQWVPYNGELTFRRAWMNAGRKF